MSDSWLAQLKEDLIENNTIEASLYAKLDVKRGLRNADGSGVVAGLSKISSVIGMKKPLEILEPVDGELRYRGIMIEDLVKDVTQGGFGFEKTVFLLLVGRHPTDEEIQQLFDTISENQTVSDRIVDHAIKSLPSQNVMNKLQTAVSALYTEDESPEGIDPVANLIKTLALIAKMPMLTAYGYLSAYGTNPTYLPPKKGVSLAENFLYMLREGQAVDPLERDILDLCLILHAEHGGGNNSTFTTAVVTSSGTDLYGAVTSALGSLKGPLHGAANKKVMDMMADIKANVSDWGNVDQVKDYLGQLVRKESGDRSGKIYGLGHAVYTKSDPRATVLLGQAKALAEAKGRQDELNLYLTIAEEGPKVFQEIKGSDKVIAPNVDFFSGFVYDCLGIPEAVYTPMFAMARTAGWCAHRIEEALSGKRVIRPSYKYIG
ncbi:citrate synthase [bacterium]|jgi:citrate synthase|nr:citrate synthase [bacterium]